VLTLEAVLLVLRTVDAGHGLAFLPDDARGAVPDTQAATDAAFLVNQEIDHGMISICCACSFTFSYPIVYQ
jgi:hypothetical protein